MSRNTLVEDIAHEIFEFNVSAEVQSEYLRLAALADRALLIPVFQTLSPDLEHWRPEAGK
jgi:hypothetical protein